MTIEIDTEEIVNELTEDHTFIAWVDERIDERAPDEYELPSDVTRDHQLEYVVGKTELASEMRTVFGDYDRDWLGYEGGVQDEERTGEQITSLLSSLPFQSESRCRLGLAFEAAVLKVVKNVLAGDRLLTEEEDSNASNLDYNLRATMRRLGATEEETPYVSPPHTDADVPGSLTDQQRVEPMYREAMVLTMAGQRDGAGAVSVWTSRLDDVFEVRKVGYPSERFLTSADAFTAAFAAAAWGITATTNF